MLYSRNPSNFIFAGSTKAKTQTFVRRFIKNEVLGKETGNHVNFVLLQSKSEPRIEEISSKYPNQRENGYNQNPPPLLVTATLPTLPVGRMNRRIKTPEMEALALPTCHSFLTMRKSTPIRHRSFELLPRMFLLPACLPY